MSGEERHPLPASHEARPGEVPETLQSEKGTGDDVPQPARSGERPVAPDGEAYGDAA